MKKWMAMSVLGLLMLLPACASTSKSSAMRAEMKRQAVYYRERAYSLEREAKKLDKLAEETKFKADQKRAEAKKLRKHAEQLEKGEAPVPLLPEE